MSVLSSSSPARRRTAALVFYEYAITFGLEVQQIWGRNISGVVVLFILTRYITLLHRILVILSLSSLHSLNVSRRHPFRFPDILD